MKRTSRLSFFTHSCTRSFFVSSLKERNYTYSMYLSTVKVGIEHVNSSVKRCRIVKDRIRLWKAGVRDLVMELCCALHNFRVRLTPWQPMV
jgi:hypothetical protein